jgi:hypothetical protein
MLAYKYFYSIKRTSFDSGPKVVFLYNWAKKLFQFVIQILAIVYYWPNMAKQNLQMVFMVDRYHTRQDGNTVKPWCRIINCTNIVAFKKVVIENMNYIKKQYNNHNIILVVSMYNSFVRAQKGCKLWLKLSKVFIYSFVLHTISKVFSAAILEEILVFFLSGIWRIQVTLFANAKQNKK